MNPREYFKGPGSGPPVLRVPHGAHHHDRAAQVGRGAARSGAYRWPAAPGWRQRGSYFEKLKKKNDKIMVTGYPTKKPSARRRPPCPKRGT